MKKLGIGLLTVVVMLAVIASPGATGQDRTEERLSAIETQVAGLEARIVALEQVGTAEASPVAGNASVKGVFRFEGTGGKTTTDIVGLSGAYLISGMCASGFFEIDTTNVDNPDELVFIDLYGEAPIDGSTVGTFKPARYIFTIDCEGPWTVSFEPLT